MSSKVAGTRAEHDYLQRLRTGIQTFKLYLSDNIRIQHCEDSLACFDGAFVPFCPPAGGSGFGGEVAAFAEFFSVSYRDPKLDFSVLVAPTYFEGANCTKVRCCACIRLD